MYPATSGVASAAPAVVSRPRSRCCVPTAGVTTILERIAAGDAKAVQECLDRFGPLVWSLARRAVPDHSQAEDAVQDIFIDVWRSARRYDPAVASETTFIATIARRRLIDRRRRLGRRLEREAEAEELAGAAAAEDAGLRGVDVGDEARVAAQALQQLRPDQRRVLTLSILGGLSHSQIASRTKLPIGTVKSHLRRGLERVRELLEPEHRRTSGEARR